MEVSPPRSGGVDYHWCAGLHQCILGFYARVIDFARSAHFNKSSYRVRLCYVLDRMEADMKRYTELLDVSEPLELHRTGRDQHIITFRVSLKALAERTVGGAMMCSPNAKDDVRHVRLGVENICITWGDILTLKKR
jgi:hypothetical protein